MTLDGGDGDAFAHGMFVALWPKVEKCESYVAELLAAQAQLQETIDHLLAGLREAEKAGASSLVGYADRLRNFPLRVERLQAKLERIEDRLLAMKQARNRGASCVTKFPSDAPPAPSTATDPAAYAASPLF